MQRTYEVKVIITCDAPTLADGIQQAKDTAKAFGFNVTEVKPVKDIRTDAQNRALHLWFSLLADELRNHGLDMRAILKDGFDFPPTPYAIKEYVWRPTQIHMFGKKSTTQLFKSGEIDEIVDVINLAVTERTRGSVTVPPFPCLEEWLKKQANQ